MYIHADSEALNESRTREEVAKFGSWGRGFRRASGESCIPSEIPAEGKLAKSDNKDQGGQGDKGNDDKSADPGSNDRGQPPSWVPDVKSVGAVPDKGIPWMHERPDWHADDVIEDSEEEESSSP